MSHSYLKTASSTKKTPQSQPIPGKNQVENNAGGFVFQLDDWKRLERFLILGSEGNTYYCTEQKMTADNIGCLLNCVKNDGPRYLKVVEQISVSGRAPKNDPALLALAVAFAHGDVETKREAVRVLPSVARIGTHLFHFADFVDGMRGWGPVLKRAVAEWYQTKEPKNLAYQLIKYQSRDGWSHRDLLRLSHPQPSDRLTSALFGYAAKGEFKDESIVADSRESIKLIGAFEELKGLPKPPVASKDDERKAIQLIVDYKLPRECVPTEWLNSVEVWAALLNGMPLTALIRNLGKMTSIDLVKPLSKEASYVVARLSDFNELKRARVHPLQVLLALATYKSGHGLRGKLEWKPVQPVIQALNEAFYGAFAAVEPTGKRFYIALDVSGSMDGGQVAGTPLTPREAASALAMVSVRTEQQWHVVGFTSGRGPSKWGGLYGSGITEIDMTPSMDIAAVTNMVRAMPMGGTDCALPMIDASAKRIEADVFYVLTDNETWAGAIHPSQALRDYRRRMGIDAKLIVSGLTSTGFSIADPNDAGSLDVIGFDANVPAVIADFVTDGARSRAVQEE